MITDVSGLGWVKVPKASNTSKSIKVINEIQSSQTKVCRLQLILLIVHFITEMDISCF